MTKMQFCCGQSYVRLFRGIYDKKIYVVINCNDLLLFVTIFSFSQIEMYEKLLFE